MQSVQTVHLNSLSEQRKNEQLRILKERWDKYPIILRELSEAIQELDIDLAIEIISSEDFSDYLQEETYGGIRTPGLFDQLKEILLQLYDDFRNYITILNLGPHGETILNPHWDNFLIMYKKILNNVDTYRYDNEIQF